MKSSNYIIFVSQCPVADQRLDKVQFIENIKKSIKSLMKQWVAKKFILATEI